MVNTLAYYATSFHRDFVAYTTARLQELGLTFGALFFVLYVGKHPGCTQSALTENLGLDGGYAHRSIARLTEDGFLLREKDGRCCRLSLTDRGQEAFQVSYQVFTEWDEKVLCALTPSEREQLFALLAKIQRKEGEPLCMKPSSAP